MKTLAQTLLADPYQKQAEVGMMANKKFAAINNYRKGTKTQNSTKEKVIQLFCLLLSKTNFCYLKRDISENRQQIFSHLLALVAATIFCALVPLQQKIFLRFN